MVAFLLQASSLSPLAPGAILDESGEHAAQSYEIFSRDRLREEHLPRLMQNTALEAAPLPCPAKGQLAWPRRLEDLLGSR